MGKRFVPVRGADRRAVELHLMLREIEKLPLIGIELRPDEREVIVVFDRSNNIRFWTYTVDQFLGKSLDQTIAAGGTVDAFVASRAKPAKPQISHSEAARAVDQFFAGTDDE